MVDNTLPPDGTGGFDIRPVDHDPFAVDPQAEPAALALPPDEPKPATAPEATPSPLKADLKSWDDWGAVGGMVKAGKLLDAPLGTPSLPTREQWQAGEQAFGHGIEHLATMPYRLAQKIGTIATPTEPETPGQLTETDIAKEKERAQTERDFGASTALQMVLGGPGAAEEGAAAMGMRGKLTQPEIKAKADAAERRSAAAVRENIFPPDRPAPPAQQTPDALWMWQENPEHPDKADARYPTGNKQADDNGPYLSDLESLKRTPKTYEKNVNLVRDYPGVNIPKSASTDEAAEMFINQMKENLKWLYKKVPEDERARSSQWYDGGNRIVKDWAQKYNLPESSVAAVIANLSPQTPWDLNVSLAKRVLDMHYGDETAGFGDNFRKGFTPTPEMEAKFRANPKLQKYQPIWDAIKDKSLSEIDEQLPFPADERAAAKALWTRLYDDAHGDKTYNLVTPEGYFGPESETKAHWFTLSNIEDAIETLQSNGDRDAINETLGKKHKVRSFYNNLLAPNSLRGDVTIDTHAVAAAHIRPLGGTSPEVSHSLDMSQKGIPGAAGSDVTGIRGTYPLYAEAYRRAATDLGVLPRQVQSVTWDGLKRLFPSKKGGTIYNDIWRQYAAGTRGIDETRQLVFDKAGGFDPPWWAQFERTGEPNAQVQHPGNAPELPGLGLHGQSATGAGRGTGSQPPGGATAPPVRPSPRDLAYEFDFGAGAPYNEQFPEWANLSGDQKATISKAMLNKIADHAKEVTGANEYARLSGLGGWHEFTNPSYKSRLVATPEVAGDFADTMGYLAQQTKIMGYRPDPAGDRLGLALYGDGLGDEKKLAAFWKDINDKHPDFSSGFSPSRNQRGQPGIEMLFDQSGKEMDTRVANELIPALQRSADDHALGKIDSKTFRATEESREHDWTKDPTGGDYTSRLSARHGPDLLKRLELFKREELEPALKQQIDAAQGASPGRGGDRGTGVQETQGAPSLPFRAAASPVKLGSGITDERTAAVRAAAAAAGGRPNLIGLPTENITLAGKPFVPGPVGAIHDIAEKYMSDAGLPYDPPKTWVPVDKERATRVAKAFEDMKHAPDDPKVRASYDAMANETVAQFKALKDSGIKFEFIKPGMDDPYAENPRAAAQDVINNKHLWVFPTEGGFDSGSEAATAAMKSNPLLRPSGVKIEGKEVPVNDLFRIVHDVFGHLKDGNGFRASGEENAWRSHSAMYSDAARPAMTSETRGQNSWVNYGPHGEFNRTASGADTKYADQKIGLLPKWAIDEGRKDITAYHGSPHNFDKFDSSRIGTGEGNQSYSHGLYFAENSVVSETYANSNWKYGNTNAQTIYDRLYDQRLERGLDNDGWSKLNAQRGFWERVILGRSPRSIIEDAKANPELYGENELKYIQSLNPNKFKAVGGNMYQVAIKADPAQFLDWEKPLKDQPAAMKAFKDEFGSGASDFSRMTLGEAISQAERSRGPMAIPNRLRDAGVPGIKYLDQGSRIFGDAAKMIDNYGSREKALDVAQQRLKSASMGDLSYWDQITKQLQAPETRNYVVFDDKLAHILKKNGVYQVVKNNASHFQTDPVDVDPFDNVLYHGTSKDKDFKKFKDARNGTWFTTNPQEASQYAVENDSMNFKYDPSSGKMVRTNTASRVIPVRHSFENTLDIGKWPDSVKHATNYKKAMGDFFDQVRAQGYDSVRQKEPNGHSTVVSLDNSKLRPAYASDTKPRWSDQGGKVKRLEDGFYRAYDKQGRLAGALVMDSTTPPSVFKVAVKNQFRRKGVATALYQQAEKDHGTLTPSGALTDEGFSFWKGYRPDAVKNDLRMHSEKLMGASVSSRYGEGHISSVGSHAAIATTKGAESTWPVPKSELERLIGAQKRADGGAVDDDPQQLGILGTSLQGPMALTAAMGEHADWDKFQREATPSTNVEDDRSRQKTFKEKYNNVIDDATDDITSPLFRAHGGRVEPKNINHAPTEAQKDAGNYAKDHVHIQGLPITIENAKGKTRRGVGPGGKPWEVTMPAHYGYIKQTEGSDGDHVDVYVGPHAGSPHVYVIDQVNADTKKFDEHKVMLGFGSEAQAVNTYKRGFSDGKGANRIGTITGMSVAQFRDWLRHGNHGKPFKHVVARSERVKEILHRHGLDKSHTLQ